MDQFNNHPLYRQYNIDSAISYLWKFYKENFVTLFIMSLAMSLLTQYVSSLVNLKELQSITDPLVMFEKMKGYFLPVLAIFLISLIFNTIMQYYIIYSPVNKENNVVNSILKSLKYFFPYLIIMILLGFAGMIAIVLGLFVLIIGAFFAVLYVMTIYMFILPVMMAEELNIGATISRTFKLAHRGFWSNIGWVSVFIIIMLVISVLFSGIILIPFTGSFIKTLFHPENTTQIIDYTSKPLFIILSAIAGALTTPLMPIFACILYFNGKAGEDQIQTIMPVEPESRLKVEDLYAKPYSDDHPDNPDKKD